mmetsp:Transcript_30725/g.76981  ORF Transcript_30725/g.76981 Transcript_30725/m.76981 type:complete len:204 (+) Transcript_30725:2842-3453(+)
MMLLPAGIWMYFMLLHTSSMVFKVTDVNKKCLPRALDKKSICDCSWITTTPPNLPLVSLKIASFSAWLLRFALIPMRRRILLVLRFAFLLTRLPSPTEINTFKDNFEDSSKSNILDLLLGAVTTGVSRPYTSPFVALEETTILMQHPSSCGVTRYLALFSLPGMTSTNFLLDPSACSTVSVRCHCRWLKSVTLSTTSSSPITA